jgi:neutral ceramidase
MEIIPAQTESGVENRIGVAMKLLRLFASLLVPLVLVGCRTISGKLPPAAPPVATGEFQAGAARADITPMPGYPMGGHSLAGQIGRGYWTRLRAKALYLEDTQGRAIVLVSCDLWSIPGGLADRVAERVGRQLGTTNLSREQIILAATHTHQSPGNFSTDPFFNAFASLQPGFDPALFDFLADRITQAVLAAAQAKQPARLFFNEKAVAGLFRNRSFEAFTLDPESRDIIAANAALPVGPVSPGYPHANAWRAVHPLVAVLRAEKRAQPGVVIGAAAFLAAHPTAMSPRTEVYQSDVFGVAAALVEEKLNAANPSAVVAIFNGAEGDVSTCWENQDRRDALKMGRLLADNLSGLLTGGQAVDGELNWRFARFQLANRQYTDEHGQLRRTDTQAEVGVATMGGAEDGRSIYFELGWKEGERGPRDPEHPEQGPKQPALHPEFLPFKANPFLTRLVARLAPPPHVAPLGVYRLGRLVLATLPGEFTTVLGRRIAAQLAQVCQPTPAKVLLIGPANEYVYYFTTPEEFDAQHYEGSSTLYGQAAGALVQHDLKELATDCALGLTNRAYRYSTGPCKRFTAENVGARPFRPDDGLGLLLQSLDDGQPFRHLPRFEWTDVMPKFPAPPPGRVTPGVKITADNGGGARPIVDTDEGLNLVTVLLEAKGNQSRWCAFWMPPPGADRSHRYRFEVQLLDGVTVKTSEPVTIPADWH